MGETDFDKLWRVFNETKVECTASQSCDEIEVPSDLSEIHFHFNSEGKFSGITINYFESY